MTAPKAFSATHFGVMLLEKEVRLNFTNFTIFHQKLAVFKKGMRLDFTNARGKVLIFKKGVRLNFTNFQ